MRQKPRLAVVAAEFHQAIINRMIATAQAEIKVQRAQLVSITRVPGSYELPLVVNRLLKRPTIDAIIVLGFIERGQTLHGEVMGHAISAALVQVQLTHGKPIGMGIIGPGATVTQARQRVRSTTLGAVRAALRSHQLLTND